MLWKYFQDRTVQKDAVPLQVALIVGHYLDQEHERLWIGGMSVAQSHGHQTFQTLALAATFSGIPSKKVRSTTFPLLLPS